LPTGRHASRATPAPREGGVVNSRARLEASPQDLAMLTAIDIDRDTGERFGNWQMA